MTRINGTGPTNETIDIQAVQITHVVKDSKGDHIAYAGDPKTATPVKLAPGEWDKIKIKTLAPRAQRVSSLPRVSLCPSQATNPAYPPTIEPYSGGRPKFAWPRIAYVPSKEISTASTNRRQL